MIPKEFHDRPQAIDGKLSEEQLRNSSEISILGKTKLPKVNDEKIGIKRLWVYGVNDKQIQDILSIIEPRELIVEECRIKNLSCLCLLKTTTVIVLKYNTKADDLWDFTQNHKLETLHIEDFPKITSIKEIVGSKSIKKLVLEGGRWKDMKLKSLKDLSKLTQLEYLRLMKIKVEDESLKPLRNLKGFKELELPNNFETKEYACLSNYLRETKCNRFKAFGVAKVFANNELVTDVELTGKRKLDLHSKRDKDKLEMYINEYENHKENCE
ncbi:MAG: hypothetical protein MI975_08830 [Cytophagales bacterium]|nr:hypothetical protein [Cytophagales bacterium]